MSSILYETAGIDDPVLYSVEGKLVIGWVADPFSCTTSCASDSDCGLPMKQSVSDQSFGQNPLSNLAI